MIYLRVSDFVVLKALTALYQRLRPEVIPPAIAEKSRVRRCGLRSFGELSRLMWRSSAKRSNATTWKKSKMTVSWSWVMEWGTSLIFSYDEPNIPPRMLFDSLTMSTSSASLKEPVMSAVSHSVFCVVSSWRAMMQTYLHDPPLPLENIMLKTFHVFLSIQTICDMVSLKSLRYWVGSWMLFSRWSIYLSRTESLTPFSEEIWASCLKYVKPLPTMRFTISEWICTDLSLMDYLSEGILAEYFLIASSRRLSE